MTNILNTESGSLQTSGFGARDRDILVDKVDDNFEKVNEWAGKVTGSFQTIFYSPGRVDDRLGNVASGTNGVPFGSPVIANEDRVITEISAIAVGSGSGGVSRWDVKKQFPGQSIPLSIFSNAAFKPQLSASAGSYVRTSTETFVSGGLWAKNELLLARLEESAVLQSEATLIVKWKPSASYGV